MRAFIFPVLVLSLHSAAAPAHAQDAGAVHRAGGYEVTLPAGCQVQPWRATSENAEMQPIDCGGRERTVFVTRTRPIGPADSTRAMRVVAFDATRQGMAEEFGSADALGAAIEFERPDRLGWRMPARVDMGQGSVMRGVAEVAFVRGDNRQMWIVMYLDSTPGADTAAAGTRILDTFRVTDVAGGSSSFGAASTPPAATRP